MSAYTNQWTYRGVPVEEPPESVVGYVYLISNTCNGRLYVGRKLFWFTRTRVVKKRRKKFRVESDWKDYWSSSESLKQDVERLGQSSFRREVLHFCTSKSQLNYLELREMVDRRVLESDRYYNEEVRARCRKCRDLLKLNK